ncbi:MAG: nucleoside hydrolase [Chloroflexi bacterium]|nr:nucleoside hydrolase [Chloroflexota bacterium]
MPKKILFDTDPGVDDAMAILFGLHSPELEFVGLTTIFGNTYVETTTQNALRLVELEGRSDIKVAQGAAKPYVRPEPFYGHRFHGVDGFGGANLPLPVGRAIDTPAAQFIVETIMSNPGEITLTAVGPLTNLALALRLEPRIVENVKEVVVMGGTAYRPGNVSPVAEANISNDPHAANLVFSAGWNLTMVGLDVTTRAIMSPEMVAEITGAGTPASDLLKKILPVYQDAHHITDGMGGAINTHDPSAIGFLIDPSIFITQRIPLYVETLGKCAGFTVPDPRHKWKESVDVNVCVDVDSSRLLKMIRDRLTQA